MNKQISTSVGIAVLIIVAAVIGGLIYFSNGSNKQTENSIQQSSQIPSIKQSLQSQAIQSQQTADNSVISDYIEYQGNKITFSSPKDWGNLLVPKVNESGWVIAPNNYGNTGSGSDNSVLIGSTGLKNEFSKVFSSYSYGDKKEYNEVPTISLAIYPAQFVDDMGGEFAGFTKKQKDADFKPLIDVFAKKSLSGINLSQKCLLNSDTATNCANSNLAGYWWGNLDSISDRVAMRYFENSLSDLRGMGYFDVGGQDVPNTISAYKVILINPTKRIVVYLYLPLNGIYSFTNSPDKTVTTSDVKKAYNYLENPDNYKNLELGQFMNEVQSLVSSINLR